MSALKLAIQKSGRLSEKSLQLLRESGIDLENSQRRLLGKARNFPLEVLYLRDDDIPEYVAEGVAHLGILGENEIREQNHKVTEVLPLGFARCRLSLAVPREASYEGPSFFQGKRIATSYPRIVQQWLQEHNLQADIEEISGSVEIAPGIGLADAVADIVSTGSTLLINGLREVETVFQSQATLIAQPNLAAPQEQLLDRLRFRMESVQAARNFKYIFLNAPADQLAAILRLLPGMKSPTVVPLAEEGWHSVQSVIREDDFWDITEQLKNLGAEGMLVSPIEKMIP